MFKNSIYIGQVWMVKGENNPDEWKKGVIAKTRPMLVVGVHGASTNCIPITSSEESKEYNKIYHVLPNNDIALLTQIKTISKEDFIRFLYNVSDKDLNIVNTKLVEMFTSPDETSWKIPVSKKYKFFNTSLTNKEGSFKFQLLPDYVQRNIIRDHTEMSMKNLLFKYRFYCVSKADVYQLLTMK